MKKSYLNTAINIALTSIVLSSLVLQTHANASTTDSVNNKDNSEITISNSKNNDTNKSENYLYPGMGVGAATGTLIAGPVGFIVGGAIGALIGVNQDMSSDNISDSGVIDNSMPGNDIASDNIASQSATEDTITAEPVQIAQIGSLNTTINNETNTPQDELMNILVSDLSLDVYFRSGSTNIEKFYPARLTAIANLINSMDNLELHLDGYTDRRGDKDQNITLANTRIERVREQLINAGVSPERIVSKAFGEAKMKSTAGNLEAYTFDRRVVIRFERIKNVNSTTGTALKDVKNTNDLTTENVNPANETIAKENIADEIMSNQPSTEISDTNLNNAEITDPVSAGFVTANSVADSKTVQTPSFEKTNPTVADATNRF